MSGFRVILASIALTIVMCGIASGKARPKYQLRTQSPAVDSREWLKHNPSQREATGRNFGRRISVGATSSPGTAVGTTYYDFQHNKSTGRQVDEFDGRIQVSWMKAPGPSSSIRTVNWNRIDVIGSAINVTLDNGDTVHVFPLGSVTPDGQEFTATRLGYTNMRLTPAGSAVVGFHDAPEDNSPKYWAAHVDLTPGAGAFGDLLAAPFPTPTEYNPESAIWPKIAISECGGDVILHAIGTWSDTADEIWYWRGIISGSNIDWSAMSGGLPTLLDTNEAALSGVIEAHGEEVTIAMLKEVNPVNLDLVRLVSTDCGVTWPALNTGYSNITNYSDKDSHGGNYDVSAAYDDDGDIHIVWDTAPSNGLAYPSQLYHWSEAAGVRLVASADWINSCEGGARSARRNNGGGRNNAAICDVEISIKPAGLGPGIGIADELTYAIWTQYGPSDTDCAASYWELNGTVAGYHNAEIYCSVSSDGGLTWDRPANLTGTVTPDCDPGDCLSESWLTAAATADSGIYISYVLDLDAGSAIWGEGEWTNNPYMVMAVETREPVLEQRLAVSPLHFPELNADPGGGPETVELNIMNVGNTDLTYSVDVTTDNGGASHVTVNGGASTNGTILAGGAPDVVTVTYDCIGLNDPEELAWRLEVHLPQIGCDPGDCIPPIDIILQVFSASTWYTCDEDTLSTGQHVMQLSSCLEMGAKGLPGVGFYDDATTAEWMYSGSPLVTLVTAGGDTVAYHNAHMYPHGRTRAENKSFRSHSDFQVTRDSIITVGDSTYAADVAQGLWSTTDTTIGGTYEMVFPRGSSHNDGAFWKFTMATLTGEDIAKVSYGVIADIDIDDPPGYGGYASENAGIVSEDQSWVGGVSGESDDTGNFFPFTTYMAVFHMPFSKGCRKDGGVAGQVISNTFYVVERYETESLYGLTQLFGGAGIWGSTIHIDTGQEFDDISVLLISGFEETLVIDSQITWGYGIAVSDISEADLTEHINATRSLASVECQNECPILIAGDVNESGSITSSDIIYVVDYVFKSGPGPLPCTANGDVDCSGSSSSADIIYLVNHVFKSQVAPCEICYEPDAQECTP